MSRLRIGTVGSDNLLAGEMSDRLRFAERIKNSPIDHLFIADHISFHTGLGMDGIVNAATLSTMFPEMDVLIGVYLLALRHPVAVARQLSSLSRSAPGRIVLGVGVGGEDRHEMEICGVNPARRGVHTNHSLTALNALLEGKPVTYNCEFFSFEDALIKPSPKPSIPILVGGRSNAAIKRAALLSDGWLGVWTSAKRFGNVLKNINELAEQRRDIPDWQHGMQLWAGAGDNARAHVAYGMEEMYRTPFEKFEKYSPYGSAKVIADFIVPYIENGARIFNIAARGETEEICIDTIAEVSEILHSAFPDL
jgi:alkanesulfonate monooxygenase SsuD/methylene tetrahydromethanopterin reductase-like flavin-dependent oxidoreductase (luciferase family)